MLTKNSNLWVSIPEEDIIERLKENSGDYILESDEVKIKDVNYDPVAGYIQVNIDTYRRTDA